MLIVVIASLFFINTKTLFYVIGALAGFSLSGVQAVSRTMVSQLAPLKKPPNSTVSCLSPDVPPPLLDRWCLVPSMPP